MRIGIIGGTFDPVHLGHLDLAEKALKKLKLDKVIFVVSFIPPHKADKTIASAVKRFKMVKIAVRKNPCFSACDIEIKRKGRSYTIDTLKSLKRKFKNAELYFIIGSDYKRGLNCWKQKEDLLKLASFIVAKRPGFKLSGKKDPRLQYIDFKTPDISAFKIRKFIKQNKDIKPFVLPEVEKYIAENKLYQLN